MTFDRRSVFILLSGAFSLAVLGVVMLMSTCVFSAHANETDVYREAKRQLFFLGTGCLACGIAAMVDYRFLKRWIWLFLVITLGLLCLCFIPPIGLMINGEKRWISLGPVQFQPSEIAKLVVVCFIAFWYSRYPDCGRQFIKGFLAPLSLAGLMIMLVVFEVDLGTSAVISLTVLLLLYVAGVRWQYLCGLMVAGIAGFAGMMRYAPDRVERLAAFLDPEKHRLGAGFQQWISLMALGSGDVTGRGLGEGRLKMLYMPFAHTDFIFPMIGEELGLLGTLGVIFAFMCIVSAGMTIAFHAPDRFGMLLATGITSLIAIQAFFNIGVTTSMLPNTGLPLPFISYGGSSLVMALASIGILVNIFRQGKNLGLEPSEWSIHRPIETPRL